MGQAKKRGSFEQRKQEAEKLADEAMANLKKLIEIEEQSEKIKAEVARQMIVSHLKHVDEKERLTRRQRERTLSAS